MVEIVGARAAKVAVAIAFVAATLGIAGRWYLGCSWWPVLAATAIVGITAVFIRVIEYRAGAEPAKRGRFLDVLEELGAIDPEVNFEVRVKRFKFCIGVAFLAIAVFGTGIERLLVSPSCSVAKVADITAEEAPEASEAPETSAEEARLSPALDPAEVDQKDASGTTEAGSPQVANP